MSVIHGTSHKAIKFFREFPAAMAVYWIYVSRANNEGVAWPSVRGLRADTGWSTDPTMDARKWLVDHEALEEVKDYVRPKWRKLDDATKARLLNLDQAQYYRPTGKIVIDGKEYDLLYYGGTESSDIDESESDQSPDVPPRRTSTPPNIDAVEHPPGGTELGISISELDTNQSEDNSKTLSATSAEGDKKSGEWSGVDEKTSATPTGSAADTIKEKTPAKAKTTTRTTPPVPRTPSPRKKSESAYTAEENKAIGDLIKAWMDAADNFQPYAYQNKTWRAQAVNLHKQGITPDNVKTFIAGLRSDRFWRDKVIEWSKINGGIIPYLKAHNLMAPRYKSADTSGMDLPDDPYV